MASLSWTKARGGYRELKDKIALFIVLANQKNPSAVYSATMSPVVSNTKKLVLPRLKEGLILLCSFTDQARTPKSERKDLTFKSTDFYAAVSHDDGKTWPDRRLTAPEGKTTADINGYLAITQTRDGRIQLITSKDHYVFNLAWIKALPPTPKK